MTSEEVFSRILDGLWKVPNVNDPLRFEVTGVPGSFRLLNKVSKSDGQYTIGWICPDNSVGFGWNFEMASDPVLDVEKLCDPSHLNVIQDVVATFRTVWDVVNRAVDVKATISVGKMTMKVSIVNYPKSTITKCRIVNVNGTSRSEMVNRQKAFSELMRKNHFMIGVHDLIEEAVKLGRTPVVEWS